MAPFMKEDMIDERRDMDTTPVNDGEGGGAHATAPVISDYKATFLKKRFVETLMGGMKVFPDSESSSVPVGLKMSHFICWLLPFVLGIVFSMIFEPDDSIGLIIFPAAVSAFVATVQFTSWKIQSRMTNDGAGAGLSTNEEVMIESCWSSNAMMYAFPSRGMLVMLLHIAVSGILAVGMANTYNQRITDGFSSGSLLWVLGWVTYSFCQFSLTATAPPELSQYVAHDNIISTISRPLQLGAVLSLLSVHKDEPFLSHDADVGLRVFICTFPLLWTIGALPPFDALVLWALEQTQVLLFGSTPSATNLRLIVDFALSAATVGVMMVLFDSGHHTMACGIAIMCGSLLSCDIVTPITRWKFSSGDKLHSTASNNSALMVWRALGLATGVAVISIGAIQEDDSDPLVSNDDVMMPAAIGACFIALNFLSAVQQPFVFRLWRNTISLNVVRKFGGAFLGVSGVARIACSVYVALSIPPKYELSTFAVALLSFRACRISWQATFSATADIIVAYLLHQSDVITSSDLVLRLFVTRIILSRTSIFLSKLYFAISSTVWVMSSKKLHIKRQGAMKVAVVVLAPVNLLFLAIAAALDTPSIPFLGLPFFLPGAPRPKRVWASFNGVDANTQESAFYKKMTPRAVECLRERMSRGLISGGEVGSVVLIRMDGFLMWAHVLEAGCGTWTLNVKGLELQETSCHHTEALRLANVLSDSLRDGSDFEGNLGVTTWNPWLFYTFQPIASIRFNGFSISQTSQTGVIDHPDNHQMLFKYFKRALAFQLSKSNLKKSWVNKSDAAQKHYEFGASMRAHGISDSWLNAVIGCREGDVMKPTEKIGLDKHMSGDKLSPKRQKSNGSDVITVRPKQTNTQTKKREDTDDDLLDELDLSEGEEDHVIVTRAPAAINTTGTTQSNGETNTTMARLASNSDAELEAMLDDLDDEDDVNTPVGRSKISNSDQIFGVIQSPKQEQPSKVVGWDVAPRKGNNHVNSERPQPIMLSNVPLTNNSKSIRANNGPISPASFMEDMSAQDLKLLVSCVVAAVCRGDTVYDVQTWDIYDTFMGKLSLPFDMQWIDSDGDLYKIVVRAYRYAYKYMLDTVSGLVDDEDDEEECLDTFTSYDENWCLDVPSSDAWKDAIKNDVTYLFTLGKKAEQYNSLMVSSIPRDAQVVQMSSECVRGIWASLSMELLYFTNDDEERYSIQAHTKQLRNITIQASEPPLGYPVYSSTPLSTS